MGAETVPWTTGYNYWKEKNKRWALRDGICSTAPKLKFRTEPNLREVEHQISSHISSFLPFSFLWSFFVLIPLLIPSSTFSFHSPPCIFLFYLLSCVYTRQPNPWWCPLSSPFSSQQKRISVNNRNLFFSHRDFQLNVRTFRKGISLITEFSTYSWSWHL